MRTLLLRPFMRSLGLGLAGALLSAMTVVMGAAPLLALRNSMGRNQFFLVTLLTGGLVILLSPGEFWGAFWASVVLVAVYAECEHAGAKLVTSALISLLATSGVLGLAAVAFSKAKGFSPALSMKARIVELVDQVNRLQPGVNLDADSVVQQIPSALVMTMILTLWIGLLWAPIFSKMFRTGRAMDRKKQELKEFRLPDMFVWVALAAIVLSFIELKAPGLKILGTNLLNVMALLYFFQGLAVAAFFLRHYKTAPFWQALVYFVLFGQLFLLVSLFGLADYWVDFRRRLTRRPAERTGEV